MEDWEELKIVVVTNFVLGAIGTFIHSPFPSFFLPSSHPAALQRLTDFLDAIFEAEDALAPDTSAAPQATSATHASYFLPGAVDPPLLSTPTLRRLVLLVRKCADYGRVEDVPADDLARIMKMIETAVREAECTEIVPGGAVSHGSSGTGKGGGVKGKGGGRKKKAVKKAKTGKAKKKIKVRQKRRGSASTAGGSPGSSGEWGGEEEEEDDEEEEGEEEEDEEEDEQEKERERMKEAGEVGKNTGGESRWMEGLDVRMERVSNALEAAVAAFEIMTAGRLPKQVSDGYELVKDKDCMCDTVS